MVCHMLGKDTEASQTHTSHILGSTIEHILLQMLKARHIEDKCFAVVADSMMAEEFLLAVQK
ncbi:MAG: hypothetical protein COS08_06430 [Euryarchaeota archaeon CG01_land_8_20_14_3_00_38_12]|nr:MAG: hypothetical protein COS08_06430 [Euryarchaeota archaeon CG01_land_8_20_14_3_00_38_12]